MISKKQKRKILIPKSANLRKCSIQLGQIDNLLSRNNNSGKRKSHAKIGTPAPPGTKLIRVKSDLFRKTSTPIANNSERVSKRTPKPNRRYVNDETVNSSTWKDDSPAQQSDADEGEDKVPGPKSRTINKSLKRKIVDEKPGPRHTKKVSIRLGHLLCVAFGVIGEYHSDNFL